MSSIERVRRWRSLHPLKARRQTREAQRRYKAKQMQPSSVILSKRADGSSHFSAHRKEDLEKVLSKISGISPSDHTRNTYQRIYRRGLLVRATPTPEESAKRSNRLKQQSAKYSFRRYWKIKFTTQHPDKTPQEISQLVAQKEAEGDYNSVTLSLEGREISQ